tara:strand:+ start:13 stop:486 length:474 start_codon:yes stop_codon:yes gene_type:complete
MKYLKEKFGKYFEFKNTTNGTDYFLRGLAMLLFVIPIGILVGVGVVLITTNIALASILILLAALLVIPMLWFSLATTYKRINAFFPKRATLLTVLTFLFSFVVEGLNPNGGANMDLENPAPYVNPVESPIYLVLLLVSLVWSLYLLFGNSKVKKHIG